MHGADGDDIQPGHGHGAPLGQMVEYRRILIFNVRTKFEPIEKTVRVVVLTSLLS